MASFTDTPVNFTPYKSEVPVEAMLQVGMSKQHQYAEGLQKVQTYVDTLGGLDISKQEVKDYVQNKMNQLHQNLNNISGDFSDNRLVSQIGGAASKIASDPIVQNGIIATNTIRTGYQQMETARKEGKSNPNNELIFTDKVAAWQNDGQVDTSLNASYSPYFDIVGKVREVFKDMNEGQDLPKGFGSQNLERDENGNVKFNMAYAGNMVNMEGISADRVQHAVDLVMQNGNAKNQLNIDGYAKYRGMEGPDMFNYIVSSTQSQLQTYEDIIKAAQSKLNGATDGNKPAIIEAIKGWKATADGIAAQSEQLVKQLGNNVDAVKAALVEGELRTDLVGAFAYQQMVESPLWNKMLELKKFDLSVDVFKHNQVYDKLKYDLDVDKVKADAEKKKKEEEGENYITPVPVSNIAGQAGQSTMYAEKDRLLGIAKDASKSAMHDYALVNGEKPPYILSAQDNTWVPNADAFGGGAKGTAAANAAGVRLTMDMKSRRSKGTIPDKAWKPMQEEEQRWADYLSHEKKINDIIEISKPDMDKIKEKIGTRSDGSQYPNDWFLALKVDKNMPGKEQAEKDLKKRHGNSWREKLGLEGAIKTVAGGPGLAMTREWGTNRNEYNTFVGKANKDSELFQLSQNIEDKFTDAQFAYQNNATVYDRKTPALQNDVITAFHAGLSEPATANEGSDAAKLQALMGEKNADDQYMAWVDSGTGGQQTYWIGVSRGGELTKVQVKEDAFRKNRKLMQAIPNREFQNMYEKKLALRGGRDTFSSDEDISINNGQVSAFSVPMQSGSIKYTGKDQSGQPIEVEGSPVVQYNLIQMPANSGTYQIKLYITDGKAGKVLVPGVLYPPTDMILPGVSSSLTQEQVNAMVKNFSSPTFIQGYIKNYFK